MRKLLLFITLSYFSITFLNAQNVGINSTGATPDASAGLDVNFTDKGVLLPRVNIADLSTVAPVTSPTTSLLVYNTNTTTGVGYYYWDGNDWIKLFDGNDGKPWRLLGNAGTTAGTNFLGTTDNVSLSFKTNNIERMRILNSGNVGIGTNAPSYLLQANGNIYANGGWFRVSGNNGLYFQSHGGGFYMTDNTWIRTYGNKNFYHNTGIMRTDGTFQVGSAGATLNVTNGGDFAYRSNVLFANTAGNVGIGTTSPSEKIDVNGNVKFSGALMPNGDAGTSGKILISAGTGAAPTWGQQMLNPSQTTGIGKFYSGSFNIPTGYSTLTLIDANCVNTSTCFISWPGNLPAGPNYGDIVVTIEAQTGQWVFHFANYTGYNLNSFQFSYVAFY